MPFFDLHWRLLWLGAGVIAVAAVLFPLRYVQIVAVWDPLHGWDIRPDALFAGATAAALLGVALYLSWRAQFARARLQWRTSSLTAGVHSTPYPESPRTVSDRAASEESVLSVPRLDRPVRVVGWMFLLIFIANVFVTVYFLVVVVNILINPTALDFLGDTTPPFVFMLIVALSASGLWVEETWASDAWVSPPRFELDELGITRISSGGKRVTIHWQDALLLEKVAYRRPETRESSRVVYYVLYGNDTAIRIDPAGSYSPEASHMLAFIEQHTDLVPRQFDSPGWRQRIMRQFRLPHTPHEVTRREA